MAVLSKSADSVPAAENSRFQAIPVSDLELSEIVGHEITLYTDQYPGQPMKCRTVLAEGERLVLDHGATGKVSGLVPNQQVRLRVAYRGQDCFLQAVLKHHAGGGYSMILSGHMQPLHNRKFHRVPVVRPVRLAIFPGNLTTSIDLSRRRWLETDTGNVSAGGVAVKLVSQLREQSYLLLSLDIDIESFPALMLGQVRHSSRSSDHGYETGIEFLTPQMIAKHLPRAVVLSMPAPATEYRPEIITSIDNQLCARMHQPTDEEQ
jgi:hypothetical protein